MTRPWTPDRTNGDGSTTMTTKRACNGCGEFIGDVTTLEMNAAINGRPLPDVRYECPTCGPTAPEPACVPTQVASGERACLELDCAHALAPGSGYCVEVREETVCATHSHANDRDEITHAEPWPCKHSKAVTP